MMSLVKECKKLVGRLQHHLCKCLHKARHFTADVQKYISEIPGNLAMCMLQSTLPSLVDHTTKTANGIKLKSVYLAMRTVTISYTIMESTSCLYTEDPT